MFRFIIVYSTFISFHISQETVELQFLAMTLVTLGELHFKHLVLHPGASRMRMKRYKASHPYYRDISVYPETAAARFWCAWRTLRSRWLKILEGAWHPDGEKKSLPLEELHIGSWDFLGWNTYQPQILEDEHATDPLWCMNNLEKAPLGTWRTWLWKGQPSSKLFFFGVRWQCPGDLLRVHQPTPFI